MKAYRASNLKIEGTRITLDVKGEGTFTADLAEWEHIIKRMGGKQNVAKGKLFSSDTLEFPGDVHVEVEDIVEMAKEQELRKSLPTSASFLSRATSEVGH